MTKQEALRTIKLLSGIESILISETVPDYLYEELSVVIAILEKIILEEN